MKVQLNIGGEIEFAYEGRYVDMTKLIRSIMKGFKGRSGDFVSTTTMESNEVESEDDNEDRIGFPVPPSM